MADIKGIESKGMGLPINPPIEKKEGQGNFASALKDAIKKVDALQKEADKAIKDFSMEKTSLHNTMIAIEKANLSFQLMVQVRNKIVAAYEEVMKTQI